MRVISDRVRELPIVGAEFYNIFLHFLEWKISKLVDNSNLEVILKCE